MLAISNAASFVILMFVTLLSFHQVAKGSQSHFAYVLLSFCLLNAIADLIYFVGDTEVIVLTAQGETRTFVNFDLNALNDYFYFLLSIQTWVFAMKYLDSSIYGSFEKSRFSRSTVRIAELVGIVSYIIVLTTCITVLLVTFPGYINDNSFE